jgi:hypothetical protein
MEAYLQDVYDEATNFAFSMISIDMTSEGNSGSPYLTLGTR